jgi:hypothetical protein
MADGFRLVPIQAEVTAGDRQICRHGKFLATARGQEGAVIADAQAKTAVLVASGSAGCTQTNLAEQGNFARSTGGSGMGLFHPHLMRIRQTGGSLTGQPCAGTILPLFCINLGNIEFR